MVLWLVELRARSLYSSAKISRTWRITIWHYIDTMSKELYFFDFFFIEYKIQYLFLPQSPHFSFSKQLLEVTTFG